MADKSTMAKANPVFQTATGALAMFAKSGDPIACDYVKKMNLPGLYAAPLVTGKEYSESDGHKIYFLHYVLSVEARQKAMSQLAFESGCAGVMDLACGYTPRAVRMAEAGIAYVGCDLPIVIDEITQISKPYLDGSKTLAAYRAVDVTNPNSMFDASDLLDGTICVMCEGLLGYLQDDEKRMLCASVKQILREHGGRWLVMDVFQSDLEMVVGNAMGVSGAETAAFTQAGAGKKSDTANMELDAQGPEGLGKLMGECGLRIESVPFMPEGLVLNAERFLDDAQKERLHEGLGKLQAWVVTDDPAKPSLIRRTESKQTGSSLALADNILSVELNGRIDTISSPDLLEAYEAIAKDAAFDEVKVDAKNLEYISSAGLRVILMMIKASTQRKMSVDNANDTVKEILANTGFATMMQYVK